MSLDTYASSYDSLLDNSGTFNTSKIDEWLAKKKDLAQIVKSVDKEKLSKTMSSLVKSKTTNKNNNTLS